jgi:tRNA-dihydrouridine synthase B
MVYKIGTVKVKNRFFLAPMASVTDMPFRILCKKYGAGLVYTEMISAEAIVRGKNSDKMKFSEEEKPIAVQLFGGNERSLVKAAKIVEELGANIVDLNMGCPYRTIINQGAGSALLKNPEKVRKIIISMVKNLDVPMTIKTRIGFKKPDEILKIVKIVEKSGASAVAVHGRTVDQGYRGKSDWNMIKKIKEIIDIPVIGSGDVFSHVDAEKMIEQTRCDFVMIGRGAMGNPFIFKEINDYFNDKKPTKVSDKKKIDAFLDYIRIAKKNNVFDFKSSKIQLNYFTKGIKNSSEFRVNISKIKKTEDMMKEVKLFRNSLC